MDGPQKARSYLKPVNKAIF